jgi:hypothetical protein
MKPPVLILAFALSPLPAVTFAEEIPAPVLDIIAERCLECHDADTEKGELNLDQFEVDWKTMGDLDRWLRVFDAVDHHLMPPPDKDSLTEDERSILLGYLDDRLLAHIPKGGTLPRRLNQGEYEGTIRSLFQLTKFELPTGFPKDNEYHGFDNTGDGLVLSPAHLEAYAKVARDIADEIFPPEKAGAEKQSWKAGPDDLVLSFSASTVHGDALRLVSRSVDIMRSCTWPSRIEIRDSGTYRVEIDSSKFLSDQGHDFDAPMILEVYARAVSATDRSTIRDFRLLHTIEVTSEKAESFSFESDLYEGETVLFHWANAEMTHAHAELAEQLKEWFQKDQRFLAAWQKAVFPNGLRNPVTTSLRGLNGWKMISKHWADPDIDLTEAIMDSPKTKRLLSLADSNQGTFNLADALCHFYHERGPALEIHHLSIEGPSKSVESPADKARAQLQERVIGVQKKGQSNEEFVRQALSSFLLRAFRRPVDEKTIDTYHSIAKQHLADGYSLNETLHLLIRKILVSPRFLYRNIEPGEMDDFDLVTRLSYLLTHRPPDATLVDLAQRNRFSITQASKTKGKKKDYWVIRREAERLMPKVYSAPFIKSFVGQWLDMRSLPGIMPDPKFEFDEGDVAIARLETERFFTEMLVTNRPMTDFIDPDFTFTSFNFAREVYGFTPTFAKGKESSLSAGEKKRFRQIKLERGGRYGGLLGQAGILMATANGVDTQPVIRGVWVLENILGMPPPEPPKNIPALTPDTQGATTPRDLLSAHTKAAECAGCHQHIDPIGFVLESYDPVGRWRTEWPGSGTTIDTAAVLPDGTEIANAIDFKKWTVENIDLFSECLAEKLMIYATGRVPNFAEKREISQIVKRNRANSHGFRDLFLDLLESETFRTR